jgi:hypothetical protein
MLIGNCLLLLLSGLLSCAPAAAASAAGRPALPVMLAQSNLQ